jgi:bla regulator protein BlaR1
MRFLLAQVALLTFCDVHAQTPAPPLKFEVASVKRSALATQGMYLRPRAGGLRIEGATLKNLIAIAYEVREFSVSGGPGWVGSDRFDIDARVESAPSGEPGQSDQTKLQPSGQQIRECLKSLLAERFELVIHRETKEGNVSALVVARNGPKFYEAKPDSKPLIRGQKGLITGQAVPMQMLVLNLANSMGRTVLDRTGLTGKYDFKLEWNTEAAQGDGPALADGGVPVDPDTRGPSIFAALQEQLGLRLETQKAPVETLLIDHVAKLSAN